MKKLIYLIACLLSSSIIADDDVTFEGAYVSEIWNLASGGLDSGTTRYVDNLDLQLIINTSKWNHEGGTFFFYGIYNNNTEFDGDVIGSHNGTSNIENTRLFRLEEAWYEQIFMDDKASIKVGLIDLNSEFDTIDPAGLFLNPAHGIGTDYSQSGLNGPSIFPSTSMAARVLYDLGDGWSFRTGVFDGAPNDPDRPQHHAIKFNEGALIASELNKETDRGWRMGLGIWHYTDSHDRFARTSDLDFDAKSQGIYAFAHGPIAKNTDTWVRYGKATTAVNPYSSYLGMGIVRSAPFGRDDDQIGFAIARSRNGNPFMAAEARGGNIMGRTETNFELSYRIQLNDTFAIQPDIQYIKNPGTTPDVDDAFVIGMRFEIAFGI